MSPNHHDIIIVGSGIAGLYAALRIKEMSPRTSCIVLEKSTTPGGRIDNKKFYGATVVTGAGIGRKGKDRLLIDLLHRMGVAYNEFDVNIQYAFQGHVAIHPVFKILRREYKRQRFPVTTFRHFARRFLGTVVYDNFITSVGYSDFEDADAYQTFYKYGMDDNTGGWTGLSIPWRELIQKLVRAIGTHNIRPSTNVLSIQQGLPENSFLFQLVTETGVIYQCKKVIVATTISGVHQLLPQYKIYTKIKSQPFLRIYAKFPKSSSRIMRRLVQTCTVVRGPLQKIIPVSPSLGVYMIAYSDNKNAVMLKDKLNTAGSKEFFCDLLEEALNLTPYTLRITALLDFYWPVGTHYYTPLKYTRRSKFIHIAQHPMPRMLVVGEVVADKQGWTEGALKSVENVLTEKFLGPR